VYAHTLDDARLAASLAATLQQFPLFAGRARTSKAASDFEVVLNGGGASFTVATSPCTLSDLLPAAVTRCGCCCAGAEGGADGGDNAGCMFRQVDLSPLYPPGPRMLFGSINKDVPLLHAQVTHRRRRRRRRHGAPLHAPGGTPQPARRGALFAAR
jgi:hypothetical protein